MQGKVWSFHLNFVMSSGHFLCQFILCWRRKVEGGEGKMKDKKIVKYLIEDPVQHFSAIQKISSIIACFSKIDNPFFFLNWGTSWFLLTMLSLQLKRPRWEICIMEINVEVTKYTTDVFLILIHWIQNTEYSVQVMIVINIYCKVLPSFSFFRNISWN